MPLAPLTVTLTDAQKREALKRTRKLYGDQLTEVERELTEALTAVAEGDFLAQYLGDQPEVKELRTKGGRVAELEQKRAYLSKLIERLDQVTPPQADVKAPLPSGQVPGKPIGSTSGVMRRF
jgi:hypothetical protein